MWMLWLALVAAAEPVVIEFPPGSGTRWNVKHTGDGIWGPGPNHWSADHVRVEDGALKLRLAKDAEGVWRCAEVTSTEAIGYGRYVFVIEPMATVWTAGEPQQIGLAELDPKVVLGLFTYDSMTFATAANSELDIEYSRWDRVETPPLLFTVQPGGPRYPERHLAGVVPDTGGAPLYHVIDWSPQAVEFVTGTAIEDDGEWRLDPDRPTLALRYVGADHPPRRVYDRERQEWSADIRVPHPSPTTRLHLNLWLFRGQPPGGEWAAMEVTVRAVMIEPAG